MVSTPRECEYFLSTPVQLAAKRRKVEKEKETLIAALLKQPTLKSFHH
jgi:hypothetical protein